MSNVLSVPSSINSCILNFTNPLLPEVNSASTSYLGKHFGTRLYHFMAIPVEIITRLADGILGMISFVAVLVTWGKMKSVYKFSMCHSMSFMSLAATIAQRFFLVINSKTEMREKDASPRLKNVDAWMNLGIVSASFLNAIKFSNSTPDLIIASLTIPLIITSVVDGIFGMLASVFALVALGAWKKCNHFVYEHLDFKTNIWFFCGLLVNPSTDLGINMDNFNEQ